MKGEKSSYPLYWHQNVLIWIIWNYRHWIYSKAGEVTNFLNDDPESSNYKLFQYPGGFYPTSKLCDLPVKVYKAKYDNSRFRNYQMKAPWTLTPSLLQIAKTVLTGSFHSLYYLSKTTQFVRAWARKLNLKLKRLKPWATSETMTRRQGSSSSLSTPEGVSRKLKGHQRRWYFQKPRAHPRKPEKNGGLWRREASRQSREGHTLNLFLYPPPVSLCL